MYLGKIVEMGSTEALFAAPAHPYTRALLSAIPTPDPDAPRQRIVLDPASFNRAAALKQVAAEHWAASDESTQEPILNAGAKLCDSRDSSRLLD